MAVTVIATPGLSTSNSYSSLADAEIYFESRLHAAEWASATDEVKNSALVWATRILDEQVIWTGFRTNSDVQALEWPRTGVLDRGGNFVDDSSIPIFLQSACAELAYYLIKGDRTEEYAMAGFKRIKVDMIELEADYSSQSLVIPRSVMDMVSFYGVFSHGSDQKQVVR